MRVNRLRSPSSRSRALCARGPNSARWPSSTPTVAVSVVSGERSSWLTSEVNLASRSMRSCRFAVIRLNAEVDVVADLHPSVELTTGDGHCGFGHVGERA